MQRTIESLIGNNKLSYDIPFDFDTNTSNGFKLSLQGKSVDDSIILYNLVNDYLTSTKIPFKVGTSKRVDSKIPEQSKKLLTIYIPNHMNHMEVAEKIYTLTMSYKGWYDIKTPNGYEHYAGCVFFRNDRDSNNNYIPAHKA